MPAQPSTNKKTVRGPGKPARTPIADDAAKPGTAPRTVRPRQLHVNDKIRIVVGSDDPEVARLDGGAFLEWLQKQDEEAQQGSSSGTMPSFQPRVAVIGHNFKPIPANLEAPELSNLAKPAAAARKDAAIATPSYISIQSSSAEGSVAVSGAAYVRYVVPTPDEEEATVEYDLDEEDEEWLQQHNNKAKQKLSEDEMEQLMDALEKMHHAELQKHPERWANLIGSPMPAKGGTGKGKALPDHSLHLPDVDAILPLEIALQGLASQQPAAVKAVYLHWCSKRQFFERPLLQRLWYEPPWHRLTVTGIQGKAATDGESEDEVPFMAQEERRPITRARKTMQLHDVDSRLRDMRDDLEQVRILADQCRRREKLRKRALATWQQDMHALLQQAITLDHTLLGTPDVSPSAKQAKLTADQKQSGGSKAIHSKAGNSKQAVQLAAEVADATENAKFEHDMALSLQLTKGVAEEAAKLHHVKIVRAEATEEAADKAGASDAGEGSVHPSLTPRDPVPSAQPEVSSPGRLTRSMLAQATPPAATSDTASPSHQLGASRRAGLQTSPSRSSRSAQAVGLESALGTVLQSASQGGGTAAEIALKGPEKGNKNSGGHSGAGATPRQAQGSPGKAPLPAATVSSAALSLRRDTAGEVGQAEGTTAAAAAAADDVGSSPRRVTRSMQTSISGRTDGATPAANRQVQMQSTPASLTHRHTRSRQAAMPNSLHNFTKLPSGDEEEAEQEGVAVDPAGSLELEAPPASQQPSSSSVERRSRSARSPVTTAPLQAGVSHEAASGAEQQGQLPTSPRQTRSLRAQASPVLSRQDVNGEPSCSDLHSSCSPKPRAHQLGTAPLTRSPASSVHTQPAPQGSKAKKSRASSTSKSVRFSIGAAATPKCTQAAAAAACDTGANKEVSAAAAAAAAPTPEADMQVAESSAQDNSQLAAEGSTRKTRSGKLLGTADTVGAEQSTLAQRVSSPGAVGTEELVSATDKLRTSPAGLMVSAPTEPATRLGTASVPSKKRQGEDLALTALPGVSSSSPAPEPSLSQAAASPASRENSMCHPWKPSLLGVGLSLLENDRLSDRGRPTTTDHPCHKKKSASMTRRTLSPPLVSPRPLQPPSAQDGARHDTGPSQLPSQLPSQPSISHAPAAKTTVDRGCDPISFSDCSEEEEEATNKGSHNLSTGGLRAHSAKSLSERSSAASRGKQRLLVEQTSPMEATRRVTRRLATRAADPLLSPRVPAAEADPKAPLSSFTRSASRQVQSPGMHTPSDRAPHSVTPAARAVTRSAAAAGLSHPEAAKAASRAGVTPAGKPPLPPTASKAVSAYRSSQKHKAAPTASRAPAVRTRGSSPGSASGPSPASHPGSSPGTAPAADVHSTARPVTRTSMQQLLTSSLGAEPSSSGCDAETMSPPKTHRGRQRGDADHPEEACQAPGSMSRDKSAEAQEAEPAAAGKLGRGSRKRSAEVPISQLASQEGAQRKAATSRASLPDRTRCTQSRHAPNSAADRVTKRLVQSARSSARQSSSAPPPVSTSASASTSASTTTTAAAALKQASVSGMLGCPKCRQAVYGCRKCRAAYVRITGTSIPIDRSLHADVFTILLHQAASSHSAAAASQLVPATKSSSAEIGKSGSRGAPAGKAVNTGKGKAVAQRQKGEATGQKLSGSGQKASADRKTLTANRRGSARCTGPDASVQQPACKKQKAVATPAATAAADTGAGVSNRAAPGSKRLQPDSSPDVRKAHADSAPPAAKRSRLSQTPKAPPAAREVPDPEQRKAVKGSNSKLSTAGKAAPASGGKPGSSGKSASRAARPSSFSGGTGSATVKTAVRTSVVAAAAAGARSASAPRAAASTRSVVLPQQAASASKNAGKPTSAPPKSQRKASGPPLKVSSGSPAPALPRQAVAKAKSVASPKAMPAAKLRQTPSAKAAAAAGSLLVQGLDSNLGCSKCRFVPTGCKRCRAKQAGKLQQGTDL